MLELGEAVARIVSKRREIAPRRAVLVGVSGIDGSGKGYVTARLVDELRGFCPNTASINLDSWLALPEQRFDAFRPAEHFYEHAIRFEEMFERLIIPLRDRRAIDVVVDESDPTNAAHYRPRRYQFDNVDLIVLEGIFLFKRAYRLRFDVRLWIDCTFETALERALARGQEGLPREETIRDYETIYFPAQRLHFTRDDPRGAADLIINNDSPS